MLRAIIDTNVFVSGLLGSSTCRKIFSAFKEYSFQVIISPILFEELESVVNRPKFHQFINTEEKQELLTFIKYQALFVTPHEKINACRDTEDNKLLECLSTAKPDWLVSSDKDLLVLKTFRNIPILTPREFLNRLKK